MTKHRKVTVQIRRDFCHQRGSMTKVLASLDASIPNHVAESPQLELWQVLDDPVLTRGRTLTPRLSLSLDRQGESMDNTSGPQAQGFPTQSPPVLPPPTREPEPPNCHERPPPHPTPPPGGSSPNAYRTRARESSPSRWPRGWPLNRKMGAGNARSPQGIPSMSGPHARGLALPYGGHRTVPQQGAHHRSEDVESRGTTGRPSRTQALGASRRPPAAPVQVFLPKVPETMALAGTWRTSGLCGGTMARAARPGLPLPPSLGVPGPAEP
ncbi:PREDICTED: proline-rich protein HaeIII subfamily 1-like, partial [Lipotes vexillifer]|uniref:Proline-rich protein HaeIII subfamily 1-like n=1 Tax=Lipotes vexillifer TaxID=118797 RepID=A0A340X5X8_LIPVE